MFHLRQKAYLDNNATTKPAPNVIKAMIKVLHECYGNPSSNYLDARDAAIMLENARKAVSQSIGAYPDEIIFSSGASESNNHILFSCFQNAPAGRNTIISTPIEHPSVLETLKFLSAQGVEIRYCPVDNQGRVIFEELRTMVDKHTLLVCCMYANNETGVLQDIKKIAALAHERGAWIFSDCVQALGKIPVDVHMLELDFASFSAHKVHGPKGMGATYVKTGLPVSPFLHGGHQEGGLRAGTESTHNIAGFGEACRNIPQSLTASARIISLRKYLAEGILRLLPSAKINTPVTEEWALCNTLSITLPGFDAAEAIAFLDYNGISVSAGSACNTQANEPSHVLKAIGLSDEESRQTLRLSLSENTTQKEIDYTLNVLKGYLEQKPLPVVMIQPGQADENFLFSPTLFILDIRNKYDRKLLKGFPNSCESSFSEVRANLGRIPKEKNILLVCQGGAEGPIVAYYLRSKGFKNVSFVMGGVIAWKIFQPTLYDQYAGQNPRSLTGNNEIDYT